MILARTYLRRDFYTYGTATHRKTCQGMLTLKHPLSGGSDIPAETAAQIWMQQMQPLAKQGVKLGAPACTGAETGVQWTQNFFKACIDCTIDFIPVHVCKFSHMILPAGCTPGKETADSKNCSGMVVSKGWRAILESMWADSTGPSG